LLGTPLGGRRALLCHLAAQHLLQQVGLVVAAVGQLLLQLLLLVVLLLVQPLQRSGRRVQR
jgi:hypothetical protein